MLTQLKTPMMPPARQLLLLNCLTRVAKNARAAVAGPVGPDASLTEQTIKTCVALPCPSILVISTPCSRVYNGVLVAFSPYG